MANMALNTEELNDIEITGLTSDSRLVKPGYVFAALPSSQKESPTDGRNYISEAINNGAVAILAPEGTQLDDKTYLLVHENPRRYLAELAASFYERQPRSIAAVTGTNGKSSVVSFSKQIWTKMGVASASIGTLGVDSEGLDIQSSLTTPDPVELHKLLSELADKNIDSIVIEASSHGLDQHRLDGVIIQAAAFTNLSHDHLDYHLNETEYFNAKAYLFEHLLPSEGTAVLNSDSAYFEKLNRICRNKGHNILTFGQNGSDIRIDCLDSVHEGLRVCLNIFGKPYETHIPLIGSFQAYNALTALGLILALGSNIDDAFSALANLNGIRGRVELIGRLQNGSRVFVDYAHTPAALESLIVSVKNHSEGNLNLVFGAGGERDNSKREKMGEIAFKLCDKVFITDDNPRNENPSSIRKQILAGCPNAIEIDNRAAAIEQAISELSKDDILIIAGKGHETEQIVGNQIIPFDDTEVVASAIKELGGELK